MTVSVPKAQMMRYSNIQIQLNKIYSLMVNIYLSTQAPIALLNKSNIYLYHI